MLTDEEAEAPARILTIEDLRRPPRYATRRNPALRTRGGKVGAIARALGKPLLPHQQYIADVALELNPPGSRLRYRYQRIIVSLPRQSGKTTLMRPIFLERVLARKGTQAFMTAQLGKDATARWEDLVSDLETQPALSAFARITRSKGSERCEFPNGSFISPFAPSKKSLHGYSPPLVFIDEGWAFDEAEGAELMKAIRPAQLTKTDRQHFIVSAAGDAESTWWDMLTEAGREAVKDPRSTTAYFEWSGPDPVEDGADPLDPESWEFHPGLDGLITLEDIAAEADPSANSHGDFLRGIMNISTKTRDKTVIDMTKWTARAATLSTPPPDGVVYAFDVAVDRTKASIYSAWRDARDRMNVAVYMTDEGADWVFGRVAELLDAGATVAADDGGPARAITRRLVQKGYDVLTMSGKEYATAWTSFKGMVDDAGELQHDGSPALTGALEVAVERAGENPSPSRSHSLGPIDPLIAAVAAMYFADQDSGLFIA